MSEENTVANADNEQATAITESEGRTESTLQSPKVATEQPTADGEGAANRPAAPTSCACGNPDNRPELIAHAPTHCGYKNASMPTSDYHAVKENHDELDRRLKAIIDYCAAGDDAGGSLGVVRIGRIIAIANGEDKS